MHGVWWYHWDLGCCWQRRVCIITCSLPVDDKIRFMSCHLKVELMDPLHFRVANIWDIRAGRQMHKLLGHTKWIRLAKKWRNFYFPFNCCTWSLEGTVCSCVSYAGLLEWLETLWLRVVTIGLLEFGLFPGEHVMLFLLVMLARCFVLSIQHQTKE